MCNLNEQERTQTTHFWADRRAELAPPPPPRAHPRTSTLSSRMNDQDSVHAKQQASIRDVTVVALGNSSVWKRKSINLRGRANENEPTAGSVSTRDNSCRYAYDGECDEPSYCPYGTDSSDCSGTSGGSNSCRYAYDGYCDEPSLCDTGTDTRDCSGSSGGSSSGGSSGGASCDQSAFASCAGLDEDSYINNCCLGSCGTNGYGGCYFCPAGGTGGPQCFRNIDSSTEQSCLSSSNCIGVATGSTGSLPLPPSHSLPLSLPLWISLDPHICADSEHSHITCRLRRCAQLWQDQR